MSLYEYRATITRVVDGDTVRATVELGCDVRINLVLRLAGINAPEMSTPEGVLAREHLITLIGVDPVTRIFAPLTILTVKDRREKFGRYLATLIRDDGMDLNRAMVDGGFAVVYS